MAQSLDTRGNVTTVQELHGQLQLHLSEMNNLSNSIPDEFPELKYEFAISNYITWMEQAELGWRIGLPSFLFGVAFAIKGFAKSAVEACELAFAGIGALLAVGVAVVDIISSVKEEKKVRDELRDTESKYMKVKADLDTAFSNIKEFQKTFCSSVIAFYRDLSSKGRSYDKTFESLHSYIVEGYGDSLDDCETKYGYSNLETLTKLGDNFLKPLNEFLSKYIEELRTKITEVKERNLFFSEITKMVKEENKSPIVIFRAITASKPKFMDKTFTSLWDILLFIAKQGLPTTECYQGYNLGHIRAGSMTKENYNQYPVCYSRDIQTDITKIRQGVNSGLAPCRIFRQVQSDAFRSQYSVIKYIAGHILDTSKCYWGYDLEDIRNDDSDAHDLREIDTALINSDLFQTLEYFRDHTVISTDQINSARHILCTSNHVCSTTWQTFILCQTWKGHDVTKSLGCATRGVADRSSHVCIPDTELYETCNFVSAADPHRPNIR